MWPTSSASSARRIAAGTVSFDDCEALTWSLGCTGRPSCSDASVAITSLTFMFVDVPDPVWYTSIGNCSSSWPDSMRRAADPMASTIAASSRPAPRRRFTTAAWRFTRARAWATRGSSGRWAIGKLSTASVVWVPHSGVLGVMVGARRAVVVAAAAVVGAGAVVGGVVAGGLVGGGFVCGGLVCGGLVCGGLVCGGFVCGGLVCGGLVGGATDGRPTVIVIVSPALTGEL